MKYYIFILIFVLMSCSYNKTNNCEIPQRQDLTIKNNAMESRDTILSKDLKLILEAFINEIDSIPNPFNEKTCYYLSFFKRNNDTLVEIAANIDFPIFLEGVPNDYESKGIFYVDEKLIAIFDKKEGLGVQFYNNEMLDYMPEFVEDSAYTKFAEQYEAWTFVPPRLLYKIENDSLILLEQYLPYFK